MLGGNPELPGAGEFQLRRSEKISTRHRAADLSHASCHYAAAGRKLLPAIAESRFHPIQVSSLRPWKKTSKAGDSIGHIVMQFARPDTPKKASSAYFLARNVTIERL